MNAELTTWALNNLELQGLVDQQLVDKALTVPDNLFIRLCAASCRRREFIHSAWALVRAMDEAVAKELAAGRLDPEVVWAWIEESLEQRNALWSCMPQDAESSALQFKASHFREGFDREDFDQRVWELTHPVEAAREEAERELRRMDAKLERHRHELLSTLLRG